MDYDYVAGYGPAEAWNRNGEPIIRVQGGSLTYDEALRLSDKLRIWARFHPPQGCPDCGATSPNMHGC